MWEEPDRSGVWGGALFEAVGNVSEHMDGWRMCWKMVLLPVSDQQTMNIEQARTTADNREWTLPHLYNQNPIESCLHSDAPTIEFRLVVPSLNTSHYLILLVNRGRKLHNEKPNDLYSSPNIVRVIKSRRMRWAVHVARMMRGEAYTGFWWGNLKEIDCLEDPGVDWRIILWWIFRKWDVGVWAGSSWLRIGTGGGHLWMR